MAESASYAVTWIRRVLWVLRRMHVAGDIRKVGNGLGVPWALPTDDAVLSPSQPDHKMLTSRGYEASNRRASRIGIDQ